MPGRIAAFLMSSCSTALPHKGSTVQDPVGFEFQWTTSRALTEERSVNDHAAHLRYSSKVKLRLPCVFGVRRSVTRDSWEPYMVRE